MEKTTKKRKKSKRLKKRIGLLVVGGLSLVLTVCLSVGATLAWFAGSTWASNDLYMGGPVYVEMAGRGAAGATAGNGNETAAWKGGSGKLDIIASGRTTGTADGQNTDKILLPGQKLLIYSQARVFSTAEYTNYSAGTTPSQSSGANTTNTNGGQTTFTDQSGRTKTTTTSVLRAKFSISVEFDPTVGFNNFTDPSYANGYPVQSSAYTGDAGLTLTAEDKTWDKALGSGDDEAADYEKYHFSTTVGSATTGEAPNQTTTYDPTYTHSGRRDYVFNEDTKFVGGTISDGTLTVAADDLNAIKAGTKTSIYEWKFVSKKEYTAADAKAKMGKPFDGTVNSAGTDSAEANGTGNGFYGLWVKNGDDF